MNNAYGVVWSERYKLKYFVTLFALCSVFLTVLDAKSEDLKPLRFYVDNKVVITASERSYITKRCIAAYGIANVRFPLKGVVSFESNFTLWLENLNYIEAHLHRTGSTKEEVMKPLRPFYIFYNARIPEKTKSFSDLPNSNLFLNDFYQCEFLASRVAGFLELYNR